MNLPILLIMVFQCLSEFVYASKPYFQQQSPYFLYIEENSPKGHLIGYVNASVASSNHRITYEISAIQDGAIIIDNSTGALYVNGLIDADIPDFFPLSTGALYVNGLIDADIPDLHDIKFSVYAYIYPEEKQSIKVYVIINDVNDNPPVFQNQRIKVNISEDFPVNTYVTRIRATDVDRKGFSELIYNIEGWTKDSMFFIKEFDGTIWTNKRLDYESVKIHILNISVTDGRPSDKSRHFVYTTVQIFVNDHDDQGAKFDQYNYHCSLQEGLHNGTKLIQVHASDLDKGINSPVSYSIFQESNPGGIYKIDDKSGLVTVQGIIDRETTGSSFYLTVQAASTIHEPATATILISINDTNDNAPFFPSHHYTGTVLENSLVGSKIIQVSAVDLDEGSNKELAYSVVGGDGKFGIDSSGFIMVNGSLDRETIDAYTFEVHAIELLTKERFSNSTNVTIFIKDVNDNSPKFLKAVYKFEVEEEIKPPILIGQLNATDKDYGMNGFIEFSIIPDAERKNDDFYIDPSSGKLFTQRKLDREQVASYSMLIKAADRAEPGQRRETLCTVKVIVKDVNDNVPYFSQNNYVTSVNEAANFNTIVFALQAYDKDIGINAQLEYEISAENTSEYFKIDPTSGIIKTSKELDRETISVFYLHAVVKDGGNKSSTANVTIIVLDINDNSPIFTNPNGYQFNVTEGKQGEFVGVVEAYDIDEGDAGKVKYSITDSENFAIDSQNGTITTARKLDRELTGIHKMTVVAEDLSRIGSRTSYAKVEVKVTDRNDNGPEFPNHGDFSTVIRRESSPGTYVYRFSAKDKDLGENGQVSYILAEQFKGMFSLDNSTGVLRIQSSISNYTNESMVIKIFARDNGIPRLTSQAQLKIYFANVLKSAPIFERPFIKASVAENEPRGQLIVDLNAKYDGQSNEEDFKYSIIHGDANAFEINEENGQLTTLKSLDREIAQKHVLIIMVQLRLRNEANFATVEVTVDDVNDNPPQFLEKISFVNIYENQDNATVATVYAVDKDIDLNSKISFYLEGSDDFKVDKNSGVISTAKSLDREKIATYNISITAVNEFASPKLNATCNIVVHVLDLNDNAPIFEQSVYHATILENSPVNTSVTQVKARDPDEGINSYIKYDIEKNDCFYIDWKTGIIRTACLIDREKVPSFQLTLIAKGITSPPLLSNAQLRINVTDVDDNHPHFLAKVFRLTPSENQTVGSILMKFSTTDADAFPGDVTYEIHSGNNEGYFLLNDMNGFLTLVKHLDRERRSVFMLEVRVYSRQIMKRMKRALGEDSDSSKFPYDQATVYITVQDVNDNQPYFAKIDHIAAIPEDAKFQTFVTKIYANDSDIGNYGRVTYRIESGNENGLFHLGTKSGIVTVYKSLIGDAGNETKLLISANDNNGMAPSNPSTNNAILHIYIIGSEQTGIVLIKTTAEYLYNHLYLLESLLTNATEANVKIDAIKPTDRKNEFHIYFHAIDEEKRHILSRLELHRSIVTPKSMFVQTQLTLHNISWYAGQITNAPTLGRSTDELESNHEIYIGIIAAIAILLIITCAFAIWAGFFKNKGRLEQRDVVDNERRTDTSETITNGYSFNSVKSTRSENRYIIEPYESNEHFEKDVEEETDRDQAGLDSSPFYTVEAHEQTGMESQRDYLDSSATSQLPNSWAYGDTESFDSEEDIDRIVVEKKLSSLQNSQISINVEDYGEQNESSFVAADVLTTGGPLFTSERMDEFEYQKNGSNDEATKDDKNDCCAVDSSCNAIEDSLDQSNTEALNRWREMKSSSENVACKSYDQSSTDDSPIPASSPSFLQFESIEWDPSDISSQGSSRCGKDIIVKDANENQTHTEMSSCRQHSALKSLKSDENTDNQHMISYL